MKNSKKHISDMFKGSRGKKKLNKKIEEFALNLGLPVKADLKIKELPVGLKQRVEILKALYRKAKVLILDEPTSVLTPSETKELFSVIKNLSQKGTSIIFISHKLKEVFELASRIVVS